MKDQFGRIGGRTNICLFGPEQMVIRKFDFDFLWQWASDQQEHHHRHNHQDHRDPVSNYNRDLYNVAIALILSEVDS